jgi:hypothetical protein
MKIFIDHFSPEKDFAENLAKRIRVLKDVSVATYSELQKKDVEMNNEKLVKELETFDIIIPIVADNYSAGDEINNKLEELSDRKDKIVLPIIYDDSQWSSINWVVKSKVFPENGSPFRDLDENSKNNTIKKLIITIQTNI